MLNILLYYWFKLYQWIKIYLTKWKNFLSFKNLFKTKSVSSLVLTNPDKIIVILFFSSFFPLTFSPSVFNQFGLKHDLYYQVIFMDL